MFPFLDPDSTCGSAVPTLRDPTRIRIPSPIFWRKQVIFVNGTIWMLIIVLQLELRNDPESGLPIRKTIKFGTNCDLSDEKKWKPQIQVSSLIIASIPFIIFCSLFPLCSHTFTLSFPYFLSCFFGLFSLTLFVHTTIFMSGFLLWKPKLQVKPPDLQREHSAF